jgi:hypothetical protein
MKFDFFFFGGKRKKTFKAHEIINSENVCF